LLRQQAWPLAVLLRQQVWPLAVLLRQQVWLPRNWVEQTLVC
jgi:hypothetical protein